MASSSPILDQSLWEAGQHSGLHRRNLRRTSGRLAGESTESSLRRAWLTLQVHADAFWSAPLDYLQGVAWRARGLRLRSRNRFAALAGRSPHAYALWIAREEWKTRANQPDAVPLGTLPILPVIDCRGSYANIERTIASLSEAAGQVQPILIGGPVTARTIRLEDPRQLSTLIKEPEAWLCILRPGDRLAADAFSVYARAAARDPEAWLIYSDDDLIGPFDERCAPHFKPCWNPDLFEHHDFISGASIVRVDRSAFAELTATGWREELVQQALARGIAPMHIPCVLHHRSDRPKPSVPAKPSRTATDPIRSVTAIIPTRNKVDLLQKCIEGLDRTDYPKLEVIVIDNGSDDPDALAYFADLAGKGITVLHMPGAFNYSALNNDAVREATGEFLCFLNNDIEVIDPDWLSLLVRQAVRPDLGAVGARLLYPDGTVQHAGVVTGVGGGAGHAHKFQAADDPAYFDRARLPQRVSAVTGACLVVERAKFLAVGGFDQEDFPVAFNDVDLCLKLNARGWQSFYDPRATLIHHESKSRGSDKAKPNRERFAAELAALKRKWDTDKRRDPYHHPHLSPFTEQFLISI